MTSNVGASTVKQEATVGFVTKNTEQDEYEKLRTRIMEAVKKTFRPEFINRLDDIIVFHPLNEAHLKGIVTLMVNGLVERMAEQDVTLEVSDAAKELIIKKGYNPTYGARPLRRAIQSEIEDLLSEEMLKNTFAKGEKVLVDAQNDEIVVTNLTVAENA